MNLNYYSYYGDIDQYKLFSITSIPDTINILKSVVVINPENKTCTCYEFLKENVCMHIYGFLVLMR